ncbi:MAG: flagellar export chaperone FliS [Spirochaetaceae bacterium]|nr:MAG: flagellar export chaperone FliS [Spirochaetaceae bacterium]
MAYNNNPVHAYKEARVRTASQGRIIVMLYDEAIRQIDAASTALEAQTRQLDVVHNAIVKAQDVVTELMASLDFEKGGEISANLFRLYLFFREQLMDANVKKDPAPMVAVRELLAELRDAWEQIAATSSVTSEYRGINING